MAAPVAAPVACARSMGSMGYPYWDVPWIGGGLTIALVATLHVVIAHFAVGAGLFIAALEWGPVRVASPSRRVAAEAFLRRFGRTLVLTAFVAGVLTGVGIWFSIGLASPRATSILIHHFVWAWAFEWVLFAVEIAAGYLYYHRFDALGLSGRRAAATLYAVAAWGSMAVINAILGVMVSPGRWLETFALRDGLLHPTFWPSLVMRTVLSAAAAGAAAWWVAGRLSGAEDASRAHLGRFAGWFLVPMVLIIPISLWYGHACPPEARALAVGAAKPLTAHALAAAAAATALGLAAAAGWLGRRPTRWEAALAGCIVLAATASFEMIREAIRKPYLIPGYLYSSGWKPDEAPQLDAEGVLAAAPWAVPAGRDPASLAGEELGRAVFRAQCAACHVPGGVNDPARLVHGWDRAQVVQALDHLHETWPFMPPVVGTAAERAALVDYWTARATPDETPTP